MASKKRQTSKDPSAKVPVYRQRRYKQAGVGSTAVLAREFVKKHPEMTPTQARNAFHKSMNKGSGVKTAFKKRPAKRKK